MPIIVNNNTSRLSSNFYDSLLVGIKSKFISVAVNFIVFTKFTVFAFPFFVCGLANRQRIIVIFSCKVDRPNTNTIQLCFCTIRCASFDAIATDTANNNIITIASVDVILVLVFIQFFLARCFIYLTVRNFIFTNGNRFGSRKRGCRIQIAITFRKEHLGVITKDNIIVINTQTFVIECRMSSDILISHSILDDNTSASIFNFTIVDIIITTIRNDSVATGTANHNIVTATSHNFVVTAELDIRRCSNILLMELSLDLDARNARQILAVHVPFLNAIFDNNHNTVASDFSTDIEHNIVRPGKFTTHSIIHGLDDRLTIFIKNFDTNDIAITIEHGLHTSVLKFTREISSSRIIYIERLHTDSINVERDKSNTLIFP